MNAFDDLINIYDWDRSRFCLVFMESFPEEIRKDDSDYYQVYESFKQAEEEFAADPSVFRVIATTSPDDRNLFSGSERFRYQVMNRFINLDFVDAEDLYCRFMRFLEIACETKMYGFQEMTDDFRTDMKAYFKAIYPDRAINKNLAFLQDMRRRIIQNYGEQEERGLALNATNVPYYEKVQELSAMRLPTFKEEKGTVRTSVDGKKNAVLLLFPSEAKLTNEEAVYKFDTDEDRIYYGIQTSDAPTEFLIDQMVRDGRKLSAVLCITSNKVKNDKINVKINDKIYEMTAYDRFKELVVSYYRHLTGEELSEEVFCEIPYDYAIGENGENDVSVPFQQITAYAMFSKIQDKLEKMNDYGVYIDYSGGLRDVNLLLAAIIRFLELPDNKVERIIYSNISDRNNRRLVDISYIYNIFQLINGTSSFLDTGNARQLSEAFDPEDKENEVLNAISEFSDVTMLNDLSQLDEKLSAVKDKISDWYAQSAKNVDRINQGMLASMIPVIQDRMHLEEMIQNDDTNKKITTINYPVLINWCLNNRMIQQALTIYVDKLPIFYFDTERIKVEDASSFPVRYESKELKIRMDHGKTVIKKGKIKLQNKKEKACGEIFYEDLFDDIQKCIIESDVKSIEELRQIREEIKEVLKEALKEENRNEINLSNLYVNASVFEYWVKKKINEIGEEYKRLKDNGVGDGIIFERLKDMDQLTELDQLTDDQKYKFRTIFESYSKNEKLELKNMGILQVDFSKYLNEVKNRLLYQAFGLPENIKDYIKGKGNTILKKKCTIQMLIELPEDKAKTWFGSEENKNRLIYVLSYYLVMKMLRNRSNHASEEEGGNANQEVEDFFEKTDLPELPKTNGSKENEKYDLPQKIGFDKSYRGVSQLLTYGVLLSQDDWQIPIRLPKAKDKDDSAEMH